MKKFLVLFVLVAASAFAQENVTIKKIHENPGR